MKKIYHYSEKKFLSFPQAKQTSIILEMLKALEFNFDKEDYAHLLRKSLQECLHYIIDNSLLSQEIKLNYNLHNLNEVVSFRDYLTSYLKLNLRDNDIIIKRYDATHSSYLKTNLIIILDNLRSAFNVGSIIRTGECFGVTEIALCKNTPGLANKKVRDIAMGTSEYVDFRNFPSTFEAISYYKSQGYQVVALELTDKSISLDNFIPQEKIAIVVGNESLGISTDLLKSCDQIVEIRLRGRKNSLNVSNASAIAIHNIINKMEKVK